jgi:uncharacterized protein
VNKIIERALELVKPQFRLDLHHGWHGIGHWSRVWHNARFLCSELKLDPTVPCWFAFTHDSQRFNEDKDEEHGHRAAAWIESLDGHQLRLNTFDLHLLKTAMRGHSDGKTEAHPIIQVCWDADRLDLGRVGIMPHKSYLCTEPAKRPEVIALAWERSTSPPARRLVR